MSAAELRRAAETLRGRAGGVMRHGDGWFDADIDLRNAIRGTFLGNQDSAPDDARWIAMMAPGLGVALADVLEACADGVARRGVTARITLTEAAAFDLARLINGSAS